MKTIIRREFLEHARSLPFMILFALTVLLFAAGTLIFVKSNARKTDAYQKALAANERYPSTRITSVVRRSNPLLFIAEGGDGARPSEYLLFPKGTFLARQTDRRTLKLPVVPPLDWSFIIGTLFSLYVILLGYNALSGEREDGTLRLLSLIHI